MLSHGHPSPVRFSASFPQRYADALADAQGVIAGIAAAGGKGGALIDARSLATLHEIYRLRVELEIETAGVLWRTAEVVAAMADVLVVLCRRREPEIDSAACPSTWLGELRPGEVRSGSDPTAAGAAWTGFAGEAA